MPNWCSNSLSITHDDPAQVERFAQAARAGNLFAEFVPLNEKGEWDYDAAVEKWGTKWDISAQDVIVSGNDLMLDFQTAWAPPISFYDALVKMGFSIDATYIEESSCFAGAFTNEFEDEYYEYDFTNPHWRDDIDNTKVLDILEGEYEFWLTLQEDED